MNKIEIVNNSDDPLPSEEILSFLNRLLAEFSIERWDLPVSFVSSEEIQQLNCQYRHQNRPTDVLTFNAYEGGEFPDSEEIHPGDIVIALSEVKRNCQEN